MPKKSVIDAAIFRAEAHLGVKHLMARFGVKRVTINSYSRASKIEVAREFCQNGRAQAVMAWRKDGIYHGFNSSKESLRSFLDRTGINDVDGRADDELVLAAIRLRRRGKKPQEFGPIIGISGDKLLSIYNQTNTVRAADVKASGEPAARIMKGYW